LIDAAYKMATIKASQETGPDESDFPATYLRTLAEAVQQSVYPD